MLPGPREALEAKHLIRRPLALALAFCCSGAAALLFEVIWFRALGRLLGNTVWTGALVLTAFMLGIALGGMLAARWADRIVRPARAFAFAEVVVALTGACIVWGLPLAESAVGVWLAPVAGHGILIVGSRLLLSLAVMLVPTSAMGMTLALGVRAFGGAGTAKALGTLYAANTLGACIAPLVAEYWLIGAIGLRGTALAAACLDALAACIAITLAAAPAPAASEREAVSARLLLAAGIAGGLALALEVLWFRLLILYVPGSDENFALMLTVVLAGIAIGGALAPLLERIAFAWVAAGSSVAVVLGYLLAGWLPYASHLVFYALPLMLPTAVLSGALFTLIGARLRGHAKNPQPAIGRLTTANTLGAALGAALAGLVVLPAIGMERGLFMLAAGYLALPFLLSDGRGWWPALVGVAALAFFPFGRIEMHLKEAALPYEMLDTAKVVRVTQGPTTTLQLLRRERFGEPATWRLLTDSYSMTATDRYATRYMQLFAWLPLALHRGPRKALLISYGAGNTAAALLSDPQLEQLTVVDLSPEILSASALVHADRDPLKDPRARLVLEDGRHYLRSHREQFDLVTAEPPPPLMAGVVNLYSREYFRALAERLAPGGLASYWLPVAQFEPAGARAVVAAFCDAFPDCTLWAGVQSDWILLGGRGFTHRPEAAHFARLWRNAGSGTLLEANGLEHPAQLGAAFLADADQLKEWTAGTAPVTDDFPKRLAPQMQLERRPVYAYARWLQPEHARRNFDASGWIRAHWPEQYVAASRPYFAVQPALNGQVPVDPAKALPVVDAILRRTDLRVPVLWLLDADRVELAIIDRKMAAGGFRPEYAYALGVRALSERDYAGAARLLTQASSRVGAALVAAYAACRAGGSAPCLEKP